MEYLDTIFYVLIPVLSALAAYLVGYFNNRKIKEKIKTIEEALESDDGYYVECPQCGRKIYLSKVKILYDKQFDKEIKK